ncbi:DUF6484 domain-containing protein [Undibacterium sp. Xuan67W]|uniref:DUF6484 domain-containing protein n=1 Tax=Undibacterium sp. Xuan67W TaxID=3413057 RepID=UPI003BF0BCDE
MLQKQSSPQPSPNTTATLDQVTPAHHALLENVVTQSQLPVRHADGIAIGALEAFDASGKPLISIAAFGLLSLPALSLIPLSSANLGAQLALGFEFGDTQRPIILGLIMSATSQEVAPSSHVIPPAESLTASTDESADDHSGEEELDLIVDGQRIVLQAQQEIELRCGDAAIILSANGHIQLRGTYITSHASATQRILGGSVSVN